MKRHIRRLGILHIVYHSLWFVMSFIITVILLASGFLHPYKIGTGEIADIIFIFKLMVLMILTLILFYSIPGFIGGIGLYRMKSWSRMLALVMGFILLVRIPFGTALGIYTIWALMNDETIKLFEHNAQKTSGDSI